METTNPAVVQRAKKIYDELRTMYRPRHTFRKVDLSRFPKLNRAFYEQTRDALVRQGFHQIADIEDTTVTSVYPNNQTVIRTFRSDNGIIVGACYHVRIRGLMRILAWFAGIPREFKTVEFETEWNDRTFSVTTNAEQDQLDAEPGIERFVLSAEASTEEILESHKGAIANHQSLHPDAQPVRCATYDSMLAAQDRLQGLKSAYRQEIGYVSESEMIRLAGPKGEELGRAVYAAIQNIHQRES